MTSSALTQVGVDDNFFELGGDSILSIQVDRQMPGGGLPITPRDLFKSPTIAALAQSVVVGIPARERRG